MTVLDIYKLVIPLRYFSAQYLCYCCIEKSCSLGFERCSNTTTSLECIASNRVCDGVGDCTNGEDEIDCFMDWNCRYSCPITSKSMSERISLTLELLQNYNTFGSNPVYQLLGNWCCSCVVCVTANHCWTPLNPSMACIGSRSLATSPKVPAVLPAAHGTCFIIYPDLKMLSELHVLIGPNTIFLNGNIDLAPVGFTHQGLRLKIESAR